MASPERPLAPPERESAGGEPVARVLAKGRARSRLRRFARWTAAVLLVLAATAFGVLPGIPAIPMYLTALFLVAPEFTPARRLATAIMRKVPRLRRAIPRRWRRMRTDGDA